MGWAGKKQVKEKAKGKLASLDWVATYSCITLTLTTFSIAASPTMMRLRTTTNFITCCIAHGLFFHSRASLSWPASYQVREVQQIPDYSHQGNTASMKSEHSHMPAATLYFECSYPCGCKYASSCQTSDEISCHSIDKGRAVYPSVSADEWTMSNFA